MPPPTLSDSQALKNEKVYSIKCTHCAAPLKILGGSRITTITCQYCNSVLDLADNYKIVAQFHHKYRPNVPFALGMQGTIKGVEWTIIGWIAYKTVDFPIERWSEFFLYSPLYGYGWLIYEEGIVSFSAKLRDFPLREWYDKGTIQSDNKYEDYFVKEYEKEHLNKYEINAPKSVFYNKSHYVLSEEPYLVEIDFVQGELSWVAKADDKIKCWDYNSIKRESLSIEKSGVEIEVYSNEKLDAKKIYKSFGVNEENQTKPKETALDRLYEGESLEESEKNLSLFARVTSILVVLLLLVIIDSFFSSKTLINNKNDLPFEQNFTITSDAFLSKLEIAAPTPAQLNRMDFSIFSGAQKVFQINKEQLYSKYAQYKSTWRSGDDEARIYLKLPKGEYFAILKLNESQPTTTPILQNGSNGKTLSVVLQQNVIRLLYIMPLFIIMLIILLSSLLKNFIPQKSKKFIWWGVLSIISVALFDIGIIVFIVVLYFLVQPIIDGKSLGRSES